MSEVTVQTDDIYVLTQGTQAMVHGQDMMLVNPDRGIWARTGAEAFMVCTNPRNAPLRDLVAAENEDAAMRLVEGLVGMGLMGLSSQSQIPCEPLGPRVYLSVTDRCNLSCMTCYRGETRTDDAPYVRVLATLAKISAMAPSVVIITGGEPCLRPDLPHLLRAACEVFSDVVLATNGTLISPYLASTIADLGLRVQVSVDSADSKIHDGIRGVGSYDMTMAGLGKLKDAGCNRIEVVSTVIGPDGPGIMGLIGICERFGASYHMSLFTEVGRARCAGDGLGVKDGRLAPAVAEIICTLASAGHIPSSAPMEEVLGVTPRRRCGAGLGVFAFDGWGMAYPCHLLMQPEFSRATAEFDIPAVDQIPGCSECDVRYFCAGGCRAVAYARTGSLFGKDPRCAGYHELLSAFIWQWDDARSVMDNMDRVISVLT